MHTLIAEGCQIAERVRHEMEFSTRCWCIVEAFNGRDDEHRSRLHHTINQTGLGSTANTLIKSLSRDVILTLSRLTDAPGPKNERQTLCRLSSILQVAGIVEALKAKARDWQPDAPIEWKNQNSKQVEGHADFITSTVPSQWSDNTQHHIRLRAARDSLRPLRNAILAHSMDYSTVPQLKIGEIRKFLRLVVRLESAANILFTGSSVSLQDRWDTYLDEANTFWDRFSTIHS